MEEKMPAEYINKNELFKRLEILNDKGNGNEHFLNGIQTVIDLVKSLPAFTAYCV